MGKALPQQDRWKVLPVEELHMQQRRQGTRRSSGDEGRQSTFTTAGMRSPHHHDSRTMRGSPTRRIFHAFDGRDPTCHGPATNQLNCTQRAPTDLTTHNVSIPSVRSLQKQAFYTHLRKEPLQGPNSAHFVHRAGRPERVLLCLLSLHPSSPKQPPRRSRLRQQHSGSHIAVHHPSHKQKNK
jgi:hypothetical protein